ncbi:uncharacterized protein LOC135213138 [Macrobrachium nipponense]|uniref:uncharacterized protein LOC135213138 n=1 Tax=Macrobrachium nipponense TaxID=159736 RepID=UPI0030C7D097
MYGSFPSKAGGDRGGHLSYASPLLPEGSGDGRGYSSTGSSGVEGGGRAGLVCRLDDEYGEEGGGLEGSRGGGGGLDVSYIRGGTKASLEGRRRDLGGGVGGALGVVVGSGRELLSEEATSLITEEDIDLGRQMTVRLFSGGMTPEASL